MWWHIDCITLGKIAVSIPCRISFDVFWWQATRWLACRGSSGRDERFWLKNHCYQRQSPSCSSAVWCYRRQRQGPTRLRTVTTALIVRYEMGNYTMNCNCNCVLVYVNAFVYWGTPKCVTSCTVNTVKLWYDLCTLTYMSRSRRDIDTGYVATKQNQQYCNQWVRFVALTPPISH